jgi:ACR3 family arsenite transporter
LTTSTKAAWWLGGLISGFVLGAAVPEIGPVAELAVTPCLIVLLFLTFLDLPFETATKAFGDLRFVVTVVVLNFLVVPLVVDGLVAVFDFAEPMQLAVLVVLLCPCIDYVIAFTQAAGGSASRLLALTPVLMIAQLLLLPVSLRVITGDRLSTELPVRPLVSALLLFILVPLAAALIVRLLARRSSRVSRGADRAALLMDPVMTLTLLVIAASVAPLVGDYLGHLGGTAVVFALFALVMLGLGWAATRAVGLESGASRAVVLSSLTRNSLVMLPIVRAATGDGVGPATVVTQTLVELLFLLILTRILPRLLPDAAMSEHD